MNFFAFLAHLAGFIAPALVVGLILWVVPRWPDKGRLARWRRSMELAVLVAAGATVLLGGLVYFGRDGKMATYAAMVLVQGTLVWWMRRR